LNTEEGKEKLRKAGLNDELDVGRWIAEKLYDDNQNVVAQNVFKFINGKEKSTLNSNKVCHGYYMGRKCFAYNYYNRILFQTFQCLQNVFSLESIALGKTQISAYSCHLPTSFTS
jgi:hypothetical protein